MGSPTWTSWESTWGMPTSWVMRSASSPCGPPSASLTLVMSAVRSLDRRGRPGREGRPGRGHRGVDVLGGALGHRADDGLGGRVDHVDGAGAGGGHPGPADVEPVA